MKPLIAIVGVRGSGRSSIIRCLTGAPSDGFRGYITSRDTRESILVLASSPWEARVDPAELTRTLSEAVSDPACRGIVCALQPDSPRLAVVEHLAAKEHLETHVFLVNPPRGGTEANPAASRELDRRLGRFGVLIHSLDGNLFPFRNATTIESMTALYRRATAPSQEPRG